MGITIHWNGTVKDKTTVDKIVSYAKFFADSLGWPAEYVKYPSVAYKEELIDGNTGKVQYSFISNQDKEAYKKYPPRRAKEIEEGETEGVIINPKKPFNTESIEIVFYPWKGEYRMDSFCKTQVFNDKEIANVIAHELIISMLETIKNTWMPNLEINDEGHFYKSKKDQSKRALDESIKYWKDHNYPPEMIDRFIKEKKEWVPHNFNILMKSHGSNLSLIRNLNNTIEQAFKGTGFSIETPAQKEKSFIEDLGKEDDKEDKEKKNKKRLHS